MPRPASLFLPAALLAFAVVTLGAVVRLSDAGLGCPDWPGCYGQLIVPGTLAHMGDGFQVRAWLEMIHRYAAGTLALLIVLLAWRHWRAAPMRPLLIGLLALLLLQAMLGMWTVTLKLMPLAVMGHLLGGLAILALLWSGHLRTAPRLHGIGRAALLVLALQIGLGGWTSANYAGIACPDFPTCQTRWWPATDFAQAFSLPDAIDGTYEGGAHSGPARTAIHLSHRIGAAATLGVIGFFAFRLWRDRRSARPAAVLLAAALLLQLALGIGNVLLHLPLAMAVAHTAGAACLLLALLYAMRFSRTADP